VYTVITENDESQWNDDTGILYHFPKRYAKYLEPGTQVVYYKGKLKNKAYSVSRLTDKPHYFGTAKIGKIYPDKESSKGDYFTVIEDFQIFESPILAKTEFGYFEQIPEARKTNYWRDGVRVIDKLIYETILGHLPKRKNFNSDVPSESELLNDLDFGLESSKEGEKKLRFVTYYERDSKLRRQAIAIHGTTCAACGFNFGKFYGEYAEGFVHVHHVMPVSEFGGSKSVNPETDLVPLCANCHSVVHRKKDKTLTVQELKQLIESASNKN